jgi:SSS family solute:Na+ symporter
MFSQHPLDITVVLLYLAALAGVWWRGTRSRGGADDYLVAARALTLPAFVATLVATWYGGILAVGEYAWRYGVSNWLVFGVPYYAGAALFALLVARRARGTALYTLPDLVHARYGRTPAVVAAGLVFVQTAPAAYILMLGTLLAAMLGAPLVPCILAAAVLSVFHVDRGGLPSVVAADRLQAVLMFGGFAMLVAFLLAQHGGPSFLEGRVPESHFAWDGGQGAAAIAVWYVIALGTLVEPAFWQRAYAARDPRTARTGVLVSIACWALFDLMTTTAGLYARALLPTLADPVMAFPELARITLPPLALGVFFVGMLATVMSTIDSYAFLAATTLSRDVVWRLRGGDPEQLPQWSRRALWLATTAATALALTHRSVIGLWKDLGSIVTPALLFPVLAALLTRRRLPSWAATVWLLLPAAVALAWTVARTRSPAATPPFALEPIYAGLAVSLVVRLALSPFVKESSR